MNVQDAWKKRIALRAEGYKLLAEGNKLLAEGNKLWVEGNKLLAEGNKLLAEGNKLWAEGDKLRAEGDIAFFDAVIATHGNVEIRWDGGDAIVEGVRYEAPKE